MWLRVRVLTEECIEKGRHEKNIAPDPETLIFDSI